MIYAVTGATGHIGYNLIKLLLKKKVSFCFKR